jgi:adenylate cyclase
MCEIPMGGFGGFVLKTLRGRQPSRKNPNMCNLCDDVLPAGGAEVDIAVLFADIRGSTSIGESVGASEFASLLNRFYLISQQALLPRRAIIDKLIGDEVMAFFIPAFDPDYRRTAVEAAVELQQSLLTAGGGGGPLVPVGIGVHAGPAYVGKVGTRDVSDFTAVGDTVNTASRLQALAGQGEIVISEALASTAPPEFQDAERRSVEVRGREAPLDVRVLKVRAQDAINV